MSWTHVQSALDRGFSSTTGSPATYSKSFPSPVSSGSVVSGFFVYDNSAPSTLTSITNDKGDLCSIVDTTTDSGNDETVVDFVCLNPTPGAQAFIATFSAPTAFIGAALEEDSFGAGFTYSLDGHNTNFQTGIGDGANVINSNSITTTANGDLIKGFSTNTGGNYTSAAGTSPNAFTQRTAGAAAGGYALLTEDFVQTTASSIAATGGISLSLGGSTNTVSFVLAFKAVASGGTPIVVGQQPRRIFVPGKGPDRGLRSPKAFPPSSAVLTLAAGQGTYTLTGQAQTLGVGMPATQGTYSLSGQAAALGVGMPASQGSYSLTGFGPSMSLVPNPVGRTTPRIFRPDSGPHLNMRTPKAFPTISTGPASYTMPAAQGTYTLNGISQTLLRGIQIAAAQGTYTLTGKPQTSNRGIIVTATQGVYSLTGKAQTFAFGMPATEGTYSLNGQAQTLAVGMPAGQGTYSLTGKPQSFAVALSLQVQQGTYALNGIGQVLSYSPAGGGGSVPHGNPFFATPGTLTNLP